MPIGRRTVAALAVGAALATGAGVAVAAGSLDQAATVDEPAVRGARFLTEPEPTSARYRVSFVVEWGRTTHPATLPPNSHVSPAVVANHAAPGAVFAPGTTASPGIEAMAEVGSTGTLVGELSSNPSVDSIQTGRRIDGPGVDTFEFTVDQNARYVSLVSMLAPSPDWFVGAGDIELFVDGRWVPAVDMVLGDYDAGTDSGTGFTSPNANTSPPQPIGGPRDASFAAAAAEARFGRIVIERLN